MHVVVVEIKCARFVKRSTITNIASHSDQRSRGRPVTKSIDMLAHRFDGTSSGCNRPPGFR
ncbi:hypothetical protein PHMEG_00016664 [Phytophthora megakarya]|uniref:Uncharacterized protein n=1 Tax=Phytophthora megakarya TaxID=4795 RepID=A0A225VY90_9STRA|nr:hypothetical protein PHMEG_00016664 [Phytophthora megakarya]